MMHHAAKWARFHGMSIAVVFLGSIILPTWRFPGHAQQPGRLSGAPGIAKATTNCMLVYHES